MKSRSALCFRCTLAILNNITDRILAVCQGGSLGTPLGDVSVGYQRSTNFPPNTPTQTSPSGSMECVLKTTSPAHPAYLSNTGSLNDLPKATKLD